MNRWRVGEDIGSKETDGCPLTVSMFVLSKLVRQKHEHYMVHTAYIYSVA
jgi:hypothetical protein